MRLAGLSQESFVDGPGIRVVIYAQGCLHACAHCQNPQSWALDGGQEYTPREVMRMMKKPGPAYKHIRGVTFSGGEPFLQAGELAQVGFEAKRIGWDVVTYTGYTYEQLKEREETDILALLSVTDYLIDGPYIHEERDLRLKFRGSANQRFIDMHETRKRGRVVLFQV